MDQKRNKSRGFAFITYQLESEATEAKTQAHGMTIEEKELVIFSVGITISNKFANII